MNSLIKKKVKIAFNKARKTYDDNSVIQLKANQHLVSLLKNYIIDPMVTVDLGSGSGVGGRLIKEYFSVKHLYCIDISEKLLGFGKYKIIADFEKSVFQENSIDLYYSNMALQWAFSFEKTISILYGQLKREGFLAFSMPLVGTLREMNQSYVNDFYHKDEVINRLEWQGFKLVHFSKMQYQAIFSSKINALRSIKRVGASCLKGSKINNHLHGKGFIEMLFGDNDTNTLTYEVGFFVVIK